MTKLAKKLNQATTAATSRRGFLQRVARLAGTAVAGVAGVLATRSAGAGAGHGKGPKQQGRLCCLYWVGWDDPNWGFRFCTNKKSCPEEYHGGILSHYYEVDSCDACH